MGAPYETYPNRGRRESVAATIPGRYPSGCHSSSSVVVDPEGHAICAGCAAPSDSVRIALGFHKLPDPNLVRVRMPVSEPGGTNDRPRGGARGTSPKLGEPPRTLRF